jgi:hypothetical protein
MDILAAIKREQKKLEKQLGACPRIHLCTAEFT